MLAMTSKLVDPENHKLMNIRIKVDLMIKHLIQNILNLLQKILFRLVKEDNTYNDND